MRKKSSQPFQKKSLSQVFLKDPWPCERIAETLLENNIKHVVEIGPGGGALTKEFLKRGISVFAVEKDDRFYEILQQQFSKSEEEFGAKFTVVNQSILDFDMNTFLKENPSYKCVCGNIPYNISTNILSYLLPFLSRIEFSLLLVQLEFAQRLASPIGKKSYGSLSVYTQLRSRVNLDFIVDRKYFKPVPRVDSALVSLRRRESNYSSELLKKVETVTKVAFSKRRKKLSNSLKPLLTEEIEKNLTIDLNKRCDVLTPEDFIQLTKTLYPNL